MRDSVQRQTHSDQHLIFRGFLNKRTKKYVQREEKMRTGIFVETDWNGKFCPPKQNLHFNHTKNDFVLPFDYYWYKHIRKKFWDINRTESQCVGSQP